MRPSSGLFDEEIAATPVAEAAGRAWRSPAARSLCAARGTADPAAAIHAMAQELVADSGLRRPAQNLPLVASLQDIVAIEPCAMTDAGRLLPTERGLVIQVNAGHPATRRNFSACHEVSHTLIPTFHTGSKRKIDASTGLYDIDAEEEYLCDLGASEILLPTGEFAAALGMSGISIPTLLALAAEFGASFEATAIKTVRLGMADLGIIVWEPAWKPSQVADIAEPSLFANDDVPLPEQKLRIRYAFCSGDMALHFFPKSKSIEGDSLVGQALTTGNPTYGCQDIMTGKGMRSFRTESLRFRFWNNNLLEQKVVSLLFTS